MSTCRLTTSLCTSIAKRPRTKNLMPLPESSDDDNFMDFEPVKSNNSALSDEDSFRAYKQPDPQYIWGRI